MQMACSGGFDDEAASLCQSDNIVNIVMKDEERDALLLILSSLLLSSHTQ